MTNEQILEIARRFTVPKEESSLLVEFNDGEVPTPTGETLNMMMWSFCEEELLAFAKSVIEADRASGYEPGGWLYERCDNPDVYVSPDAAFSWFQEGRYTIPLYTRPPLPRKPLSDEDIDDVMQSQCWDYGFDDNAIPFARSVEKKIWEKMRGIGEIE